LTFELAQKTAVEDFQTETFSYDAFCHIKKERQAFMDQICLDSGGSPVFLSWSLVFFLLLSIPDISFNMRILALQQPF
jgi:hypothetical protein